MTIEQQYRELKKSKHLWPLMPRGKYLEIVLRAQALLEQMEQELQAASVTKRNKSTVALTIRRGGEEKAASQPTITELPIVSQEGAGEATGQSYGTARRAS